MTRSRPPVRACWLGSLAYREAWDLQRSLAEQVGSGEAPDTLLLLEHPHVFTMGRRGDPANLLWDEAERERRGVELVWSDRGGDATYHGPGQLVGYPILKLERHGGDLLDYMRTLERSVIDYLATFGVAGRAIPGLTGVWMGDEKICAIGVKVSHGVTSHGFALNLTTDLEYFEGIVGCGLHDRRATSLERLAGRRVATAEAAAAYSEHFGSAFGVGVDFVSSLNLPAQPLSTR
jgi:lipoyl(octanoyl) transferase